MFDVGVDVLASTLDPATNTITFQLGDVTKDHADSDFAEAWYGSPGIIGRPAPPDQGKASCQCIALKRGDHDLPFAYRDLRSSSIYGQLGPGETCVYATKGMARVLMKADGSVTRFTTENNQEGGVSITDRLGPDGWTLTTPWGQVSLTAQGFSLSVEGGGAITISPLGALRLLATQAALQGSIVSVAGDIATCIGAKCVPVPGVNSALYGPSGVTGLPSANVFIAPAP